MSASTASATMCPKPTLAGRPKLACWVHPPGLTWKWGLVSPPSVMGALSMAKASPAVLTQRLVTLMGDAGLPAVISVQTVVGPAVVATAVVHTASSPVLHHRRSASEGSTATQAAPPRPAKFWLICVAAPL